MASKASALDEVDITSQASGFHYLDLNSEGWAESQPRLRSWFELDGNSTCVECGARIEPADAWVSVTLAASLCKCCAGQHRALGRDISAVKSLTLDAWSSEDIDRLWAGGNGLLREALGRAPAPPAPAPDGHQERSVPGLRWIYSGLQARQHRQRLDRVVARSPCGPSTSSTAPDAAAHVDALSRRPGYFSTKNGLGYAGPDGLKARPLGLLRGLALAADRCLARPGRGLARPGLPDLRELSSLGDVRVAGAAGQLGPSIFRCAERGDAAEVERLLRAGRASVDDADELGWTPLFYAAKFGRDAVCELLLRWARNPRQLANTRERGGMGWTPLYYAAEMGCSGCAYLLLRAGAAPNGLACGGGRARTPLRLACFNGRRETVDVLLGFGADPALLPKAEYEPISEERVAASAARFAWLRARPAYLLRDKAEASSGPERALVKLLRKPIVFASVAKYL